ncbi:hypothetical protein [Thalassobellus sediminis]|uniref:hypothetical protein n=1 Tax=Thalassobellus sediminis TaxID=3367753 RepID=UPI00378C961A
MKKTFLIFLSIVVLSCSNNDDSTQNSNPNQLFLKQINKNGLISSKYLYQNELVSSREYYDSGELWRTETLEYSGNTISINSYNSSGELTQIRKYYAISESTFRRDRYNSNNELTNYRIHTFSDNNCGFVSIGFYNNNDVLTSTNTFQYFDDNCSMESINFDSNNEIVFTEEWIRDDKNQYRKNEILDFFRADNLGNTTIFNRWDSQNNIETEYSYESSFEYNTYDYPISEQRNYLNGTSDEFTYEYY